MGKKKSQKSWKKNWGESGVKQSSFKLKNKSGGKNKKWVEKKSGVKIKSRLKKIMGVKKKWEKVWGKKKRGGKKKGG